MRMAKLVLIGIGNEMQHDDGVGNAVAREFRAKRKEWLSIPCETVPENFLGVVQREKPRLIVIIDAANIGLEAGQFRIIPKEKLNSTAIGTHGIPLAQLVTYLEKQAGKIIFIGVQPGRIALGEGLSKPLKEAKKRLIEILEKRAWKELKKLNI